MYDKYLYDTIHRDTTTTNLQTTRPYPFFRLIPDQSDYNNTVDNSAYRGIGDISQEPLLDYLDYEPVIFHFEHNILIGCRFENSSPEPVIENSNVETSIDQPDHDPVVENPEHDPVVENPDHGDIINISKEPLINCSAHNVVISRPSLWYRRIADSSDYDDIFDNSYYESIGGISEEPLLGHPDYDDIIDNSHNFDNCEDEPVIHPRNLLD